MIRRVIKYSMIFFITLVLTISVGSKSALAFGNNSYISNSGSCRSTSQSGNFSNGINFNNNSYTGNNSCTNSSFGSSNTYFGNNSYNGNTAYSNSSNGGGEAYSYSKVLSGGRVAVFIILIILVFV